MGELRFAGAGALHFRSVDDGGDLRRIGDERTHAAAPQRIAEKLQLILIKHALTSHAVGNYSQILPRFYGFFNNYNHYTMHFVKLQPKMQNKY